MAPLSLLSGVDYAKTLLPETLMRSVSSFSRQAPVAQRRSFRVLSCSRRRRRHLEATTRRELLQQASRLFVMSGHFLSVVLEEDGTEVDSEEFFQSLPNNTALMVLEKEEMWTESKMFPSFRQPKRSGVARLTFDLYRRQPRDFLCCLVVKATLFDAYTLCYDFRCTRIKHLLRSVLRCLTWITRLGGQLLLYTSSSLLQYTADDDA